MTAETEYQRLIRERRENAAAAGTPVKRGRVTFTPEVAKARAAERARRHAESRRRANMILATRYPDEYATLLEQEMAGVLAERGPLPGDDA